jgi:hypothetical protein
MKPNLWIAALCALTVFGVSTPQASFGIADETHAPVPVLGGNATATAPVLDSRTEYAITHTASTPSVQYFRYDLPQNERITMVVTGTLGRFGQMNVDLIGDTGGLIRLNTLTTDGQELSCSYVPPSTAKRVYIRSRSLVNGDSFRLVATTQPHEDGGSPGDAGGSRSTAKPITPTLNIPFTFDNNWMASTDEDDAWRITPPPGAIISATFTALEGDADNTSIELYDQDAVRLSNAFVSGSPSNGLST